MEQYQKIALQEQHLLNQIHQQEQRLAELIEENNSLESGYLHQKIKYFKEERPILLHNLMTEIESETLQNSPFANSDLLIESINQYNTKKELLDIENTQLSEYVDSQRNELLSLLKQFREPEQPKIIIKPPDTSCSTEVEQLARQIAQEIDKVSEDDLVKYLARGPSDGSQEVTIEKAKELGQLNYSLKCSSTATNLMQTLISRIQQIDIQVQDTIDEQHMQLLNTLDNATNVMNGLLHEDEFSGADSNEDNWKYLESLEEDVKLMRKRLLAAVSDGSKIQIPSEMVDTEREKSVLNHCLEVLKESNAKMIEHLHNLTEQGIVDYQIHSEDEVKQIIAQYNEMKLRSGE
ncbi:hypothetical protein GPJ56_001345 [Histomonas meleagridis]|uniref:uncharacterized protein n=1 Tax=Histomonas meleagridis TaxID=135588 RepID=UPI0035594307|nr:hypothetical protein GPJ56_001345 [Histomonas meleagridis]KAH0805101.1 hypothetical protein GO595_002046 [Histomonas meleagridis]